MQQFYQSLLRQNQPHLNNKQVDCLYKDIKRKIQELDEVQSSKSEKELKRYLNTFSKIIETISNDVRTAKQRYQNIDKQKLIEQKLISLCTSIRLFKEQAKIINKQIEKTEEKLQNITLLNNISQFQNQSLMVSLKKRSRQKQCSKGLFLTQQKIIRQNSLQILENKDKARQKAQLSQQSKTLSSFHNKASITPSKRHNFQDKKYKKIWGYSQKLSNGISSKLQ